MQPHFESSIPELPRYEFSRSTRLSEQEKKELEEILDEYTIEFPEKPLEESSERTAMIAAVTAAHIEWAKSALGISLMQRLPQKEKIKFFSPEEFEKIRKRLRKKSGAWDFEKPVTRLL